MKTSLLLPFFSVIDYSHLLTSRLTLISFAEYNRDVLYTILKRTALEILLFLAQQDISRSSQSCKLLGSKTPAWICKTFAR